MCPDVYNIYYCMKKKISLIVYVVFFTLYLYFLIIIKGKKKKVKTQKAPAHQLRMMTDQQYFLTLAMVKY